MAGILEKLRELFSSGTNNDSERPLLPMGLDDVPIEIVYEEEEEDDIPDEYSEQEVYCKQLADKVCWDSQEEYAMYVFKRIGQSNVTKESFFFEMFSTYELDDDVKVKVWWLHYYHPYACMIRTNNMDAIKATGSSKYHSFGHYLSTVIYMDDIIQEAVESTIALCNEYKLCLL
jgi:hypothetical protein